MKSHKSLLLAVITVFAMSSPLSVSATTQDTRPRYSSTQSVEQSWTIPPDTVISVQMNGTLTSRTAHVGDKFNATVTVPVYVNGRTVIPAGAIVEGRITQVTPAKRMNRSGTIGVDFDDIVFPNGSRVGLIGSLTSSDPSTRKRIDDESNVSAESNNRPAVFVGASGAIGAVLGGIAGGGKGAVLGGVAGAGAGVAGVLLSKGEEAQVPSGSPFGVQLKQPLIIRESLIIGGTPDRQADQPGDQSGGDPLNHSADRPGDRSAERQDRRDSVNPPPNNPLPNNPPPENVDRSSTVNRPEPENGSDADRTDPASVDQPLSSPEMVRRAQLALKDQGYYEGEADGVMNARTSGALRSYQREHNLQVTGDLDPQTAAKLGITGTGGSSSKNTERPADRTSDRSTDRGRSDSSRDSRTDAPAPTESVRASVVSATANRTQDGSIAVTIITQANTGGWRWFGEHVINGDTLEVYARAVKPAGMSTQALSRGKIELLVRDGVQYVRRVVVHSATVDQEIALSGRIDNRADSGRIDSRPDSGRVDSRPEPVATKSSVTDSPVTNTSVNSSAVSAASLQQKAEDLLAEYQRLYGVRMTGTSVEVANSSQYREPEIELLFAIDSFANAAQLYSRLTASLRDRQSMRGATLAMARQARRTDRVISTTNSRGADALAVKWDSLRLDILKLMQIYNISSSEIEN
jgi:hypothetical protein